MFKKQDIVAYLLSKVEESSQVNRCFVAGLESTKLLGQKKHVLLLSRLCHLGYFSNTCFKYLGHMITKAVADFIQSRLMAQVTTGERKGRPSSERHLQTKTCGEVHLTVEFVTFPEWQATQTPKFPQGDLAQLLTPVSLWRLRYVQDSICLCSSRIVRGAWRDVPLL